MDIKKFRRILIINDDDTEEQFYKKYDNLQKYKDMISYCNDPIKAFEYITSKYFYGFDKIILDIKIEWEVPEKYIPQLNEYVDVKALNNANKGFLMFMYLVARGYPINRIAFLSAYIKEKDEELEEKTRILEEIKTWKKRAAEQDSWLMQNMDQIPSLKGRIIRILKNNSYRGIKAYEEIKKILIQDIDTGSFQDSQSGIREEMEDTESFFGLLSQTGLIVKNQINKKDKDKLEEWIEKEKTEDHKNYYMFRNMVLNVCEYVMNKSPNIYKDIKNVNLKNNYPPDYFEELMKKIQHQISAFKEDEDMEKIAESTVGNLVAFGESISKTPITYTNPPKEDINHHALTMLLKNTRNWYAHGRLKKIGIAFCEFIFLSSVRIIYGDDETLSDYIERDLHLNTMPIDVNQEFYKKIWKDINEQTTNTSQCKAAAYIINIDDLYYKYSHEDARKNITLTICDLYEMFLLCIHFPYVTTSDIGNDSFQIVFYEINYAKQERYMLFLEKIAIEQWKTQQKKLK